MTLRQENMELKRYMISTEACLEETKRVLFALNSALSDCALEFRGLLRTLVQINVAIFNAVVSVSLRFAMPKSICFNQPVTFQDAVGKYFPIHLECINSWKASSDNLRRLTSEKYADPS